jgi:hypothetical protein
MDQQWYQSRYWVWTQKSRLVRQSRVGGGLGELDFPWGNLRLRRLESLEGVLGFNLWGSRQIEKCPCS